MEFLAGLTIGAVAGATTATLLVGCLAAGRRADDAAAVEATRERLSRVLSEAVAAARNDPRNT